MSDEFKAASEWTNQEWQALAYDGDKKMALKLADDLQSIGFAMELHGSKDISNRETIFRAAQFIYSVCYMGKD